MGRRKTNHVYHYYTQNDEGSKCILCHKVCKTSHGSNLMRHLEIKHPDQYNEVLLRNDQRIPLELGVKLKRKLSNDDETINSVNSILHGDQDSDESQDEDSNTHEYKDGAAVSQVTRHFYRESGGRASCKLCGATVPYNRDDMTVHMQRKHNKCRGLKQETQDPIDDDSNYNEEVVYLDEPLLNISSSNPKRKKTMSPRLPSLKVAYTSKDKPLPPKLTKKEEEIEKFGAYIIQLLKSTPPEVCNKLQMDIVALIMGEKLKLESNNVSMSEVVIDQVVGNTENCTEEVETAFVVPSQ